MTENRPQVTLCRLPGGFSVGTFSWNELLSDLPVLQIFVDNFVHADLHPGNILVQGTARLGSPCPEQAAVVDLCDTLVLEVRPLPRHLRLVLLDAGIVAELQSADMQNFRAVFTAVVQGQVRPLRQGAGKLRLGNLTARLRVFSLFPLKSAKRGKEAC